MHTCTMPYWYWHCVQRYKTNTVDIFYVFLCTYIYSFKRKYCHVMAVCWKPAKQSTSRDVSFTSNSVAVNSINITPSTSNAVSVTSSASDSDSASVPVSSTPCHVTSTSSKTGALDLFSPLQECKFRHAAIFVCVTSVLVHGQVTIIFAVSVCLFVCAEFFSAVFDPISIKLGHMLYVWV